MCRGRNVSAPSTRSSEPRVEPEPDPARTRERERSPSERDALFALAKQPEHDAPLPHDALVVRPRRELLPDVAPLAVVDAVEEVDARLERERGKVGRRLGHGVQEAVQVVVRRRDRVEEGGWGCARCRGASAGRWGARSPRREAKPEERRRRRRRDARCSPSFSATHRYPIPTTLGSHPTRLSSSHRSACSTSSRELLPSPTSAGLRHAAVTTTSSSAARPSLTLERRTCRLR